MKNSSEVHQSLFSINWKSPGIVVFVVTIMSYALAYCFQVGYLSRYKIDPGVISISVPQLFMAALFLILVAVVFDILIGLLKIFAHWSRSENMRVRVGLIILILTVLFTLAAVLIQPEYPRIAYPSIAIAYILVLIMVFAKALYVGYNLGNYKKGFERYFAELDKARDKERSNQLNKNSQLVVLPHLLAPIIVAAALCASYVGLGFIASDYRDSEVLIVSREKNKVEFVVAQYGNNIVTKEYDTQANHLNDTFSVKEATNRQFSYEVIACTDQFKNQSPKQNPLVTRCPK